MSRAWLWLALLWLCGCAAPQPQLAPAVEQSLPQPLRLDVPFFAQTAYHCGPAALAAVLNHRGETATPEQLASRVYLPGRKGSLTVEMLAAARSADRIPYPIAPGATALLRELAAGNPVLVLQNLGFDWWPQWHYAVAVGYDRERGELLLHSGTRAYYAIALGTFVRTWARADHWGFVIAADDALPATAQELPWLQAVNALERTGHAQAALRGYRLAARRWPRSAAAQFALGNAALAQGLATEAVDALLRAVENNPALAAAWNNLGYALNATGCYGAARQAVQRAIVIAPEESRYRESLDDLRGGENVAQRSCPVLPP